MAANAWQPTADLPPGAAGCSLSSLLPHADGYCWVETPTLFLVSILTKSGQPYREQNGFAQYFCRKKTSKPLKHCDHPSVSLPPQEKKEFKNNILKPELSPLEGQSPKPAAKTWSETSNGAGLGHVQLQKNPKPNNIQFQLSFTQYQQKEI